MQTKCLEMSKGVDKMDCSPEGDYPGLRPILDKELCSRKELINKYQEDPPLQSNTKIDYAELRYIFLKYFDCDITTDELEFMIRNHFSRRKIYLDTTRIKKSDLALFFLSMQVFLLVVVVTFLL